METQLKLMANNVLQRMEKGAFKKEFEVKDAQEWYFTYGAFVCWLLHKTKFSKKVGEFDHVVARKRTDRLVEKLVDLYTKCYVGTNLENDYCDGIIKALLAYKFDEEEKKVDGREAYNFGKVSEEEFCKGCNK